MQEQDQRKARGVRHMKRSISFRTSNKMTSIAHNNRTEEDERKLKDIDKHIRWDDVSKNVVLESKDIREVYHEQFHEDVLKYNFKQKRKDRKIDQEYGGYYKKIRDEKGKGNAEEQREFIVQFGTKDDEPFDIETSNAMFTEYLEEFRERNPDMVVYNAVIHNDEATPHMHINIVPVGRGYKRGVASKPSFTKALKTSGVTFDEFMDVERDSLAKIMKEHTNEDRKLVGTHDYTPPGQYRELMTEAEGKVEEASEMMEKAQMMMREAEKADKERQEANKRVSTINKAQANARAQKERNEARTKELDDREAEVSTREGDVKKREDNVTTAENALETQISDFEGYKKKEIDGIAESKKNANEVLEKANDGIVEMVEKMGQLNSMTVEQLEELKQETNKEQQNKYLELIEGLSDDDLEELSNDKGQQL